VYNWSTIFRSKKIAAVGLSLSSARVLFSAIDPKNSWKI